jgi:hypothetical protein
MLEPDRSWRRNNNKRVDERIVVWNGSGVQRSKVSATMLTVVLPGHYMKCRGPRALGVASCAIPQQGVEFRFGNSETVGCESTWSASDCRTWCSVDVVDGVLMHLALISGGTSEITGAPPSRGGLPIPQFGLQLSV